jgi:hypothetical protein
MDVDKEYRAAARQLLNACASHLTPEVHSVSVLNATGRNTVGEGAIVEVTIWVPASELAPPVPAALAQADGCGEVV